MANPLHSANETRWGTPKAITRRAHSVMQGIDLDVCSEARFQDTVQAGSYYSLLDRGEDALTLPWNGRVFVNPPGRQVKPFWRKLMKELRDNDYFDQAIWIGFSLEQLAILADQDEHHPADFSVCYLRKRISFERHDGYSESPTHGNYICYIGSRWSSFYDEFHTLGRCFRGPLADAL